MQCMRYRKALSCGCYLQCYTWLHGDLFIVQVQQPFTRQTRQFPPSCHSKPVLDIYEGMGKIIPYFQCTLQQKIHSHNICYNNISTLLFKTRDFIVEICSFLRGLMVCFVSLSCNLYISLKFAEEYESGRKACTLELGCPFGIAAGYTLALSGQTKCDGGELLHVLSHVSPLRKDLESRKR